jgi:elongation factor Tu
MFRMPVEDVFFLTNRGLVATGRIESGTVRTGEEVRINDRGAARVTGIEMFRKVLDEGIAGDAVGIYLEGIDRDDLKSGDVLTRDAPAP